MTQVNPAILIWSRESAGLSLGEAAVRIGLRDTKRSSAADRLAALEAGQGEPTRATLLRMAKAYRRPLLTFYLPTPPPLADRGEDFRTLPEDQRAESAAAVDALLRDVRGRQSAVRALLDDEEAGAIPFVGSIRMDAGVASAADALGTAIGFDLQEFRAQRNAEYAFNYLRRKVEATGVFVLLMGNLGSHHSAIDVGVFRGLALADDVAPFVVINDQDAKAAWSFTLLHELAHILLGATGISGGALESRIERFCNDVASRLLLPAAELAAIDLKGVDQATAQRLISEFSQVRNISRALVAYRLRLAGVLSEDRWRAVSGAFREEYLRERAERRERGRETEGGPNYYVVKRQRLGLALLQLVRRTLEDGALTPTKAGKILGVRPRNVESLVAEAVG